MAKNINLDLKRVYDQPKRTDGFRILVDRLWPRGLSKEKARVDLWLKEIAPSQELRKWFGHDPTRWEQFKTKYRIELQKKPGSLIWLKDKASEEHITLLYSASDTAHNNAIALREFVLILSP
jgi:uncharacterized protein YeaO (DUF488 family)